jgi:MFS superfamily sulfate permease-like transporter
VARLADPVSTLVSALVELLSVVMTHGWEYFVIFIVVLGLLFLLFNWARVRVGAWIGVALLVISALLAAFVLKSSIDQSIIGAVLWFLLLEIVRSLFPH